LWTARTIGSELGFDYRGRRAIHGTWLLWAAAGVAHVLYGCACYHVSALRLAPVALVLGTRWVRNERGAWGALAWALVLAAVLDPPSISTTAAMIAVVLVLRAFRAPADPSHAEPLAPPPAPYRGAPTQLVDVVPSLAEPTFAWAERAERERWLLGALAMAHLAAWTSLVAFEPRMPHLAWLDLLLVATCFAWASSRRSPRLVLPLAPVGLHWLLQSGTVVPPRTIIEHGVWAIATGFALLFASLARAWWRGRAIAVR
jgi:hypothetical protein